MGLRKDFSIHRRRTVESFKFVKADISSVNNSIENLKNMLASLESRVSSLDMGAADLRKSIEKCLLDISLQQNNNLNLLSKIDAISKSILNATNTAVSIKNKIGDIVANNQKTSKKISANNDSIKNLSLKSKKQTAINRKLNSASNQSQKEIKKIRNFLSRKLRTVNRKNAELEITIKKQRKRIISLNKRIEGKKLAKAIKKKTKRLTPITKKTTKKVITPKKTIVEVVQKEVKQ